jgi:hypothetical protein
MVHMATNRLLLLTTAAHEGRQEEPRPLESPKAREPREQRWSKRLKVRPKQKQKQIPSIHYLISTMEASSFHFHLKNLSSSIGITRRIQPLFFVLFLILHILL